MPLDPREQVVRFARLLFERQLFDTTGGNLSVRRGDRVFCSPSFAASRQQWQIENDDVVVMDLEGNVVEGPDRKSRETQIHLGVYRRFSKAGGVIHGQAGHYMPFVLAARPIPSVLELAERLGTIGVAARAKAHSAELASNVVAALSLHEADLEKHGIATLLPRHGIVVVDQDLAGALETLERIENNARAVLLMVLLNQLPTEWASHG
jgi:L-fuculose-phosphate aldolase